MKRFFQFGLLSLAVVLGMSAQSHAAVSVTDQFFDGEDNVGSDDSGEFLVNFAGGTTTLDIGDVLLSVFKINTIRSASGSTTPGAGIYNEFTGLAAIQVTGKSGSAGAFTFDFGAVSLVNRTAIAALVPFLGPELFTWDADSAVALFDDPSQNYTMNTTTNLDDGDNPLTAADEDVGTGPFVSEGTLGRTAVDGTKILEIGFGGPGTTFWNAVSPTDSVASVAASLIQAVTFQFALNVTANFTTKDYVIPENGVFGTQFEGS